MTHQPCLSQGSSRDAKLGMTLSYEGNKVASLRNTGKRQLICVLDGGQSTVRGGCLGASAACSLLGRVISVDLAVLLVPMALLAASTLQRSVPPGFLVLGCLLPQVD